MTLILPLWLWLLVLAAIFITAGITEPKRRRAAKARKELFEKRRQEREQKQREQRTP